MIQRLNEFIESLGLSTRAFEIKISASNGLIRKAITNNTDIQSKWLTNIIDNFPQLNIIWLLTGRGSMINEEDLRIENGENNEMSSINLLPGTNESLYEKVNLLIKSINKLNSEINDNFTDLRLDQEEFRKSQRIANEIIMQNLGIGSIKPNSDNPLLHKRK
ncbi:TPA: hypothetical protein ACGZ9U_003509 [Elizabethkingia anophelis]